MNACDPGPKNLRARGWRMCRLLLLLRLRLHIFVYFKTSMRAHAAIIIKNDHINNNNNIGSTARKRHRISGVLLLLTLYNRI